MKYSKANTVNTQRFIARYGKAAQYPLCQVALGLWKVRAEIRKYAKEALSLGELLRRAKRQKEQTRALYEQIYKEEKHKEAIEAAALVREIDDFFKKTHIAFEANVNLFEIFSEVLFPVAVAQFESECDAVVRTKDTKAIEALKRVKKRWYVNPSGKGARLRAGDQRELEILNMHRDKVVKAAWAKDGAGAGYLEAARGGSRLLSDEAWSGRFTNKQIYSHLLSIGGSRLAGDKDGKEVRRLLKKLGIRPAEDQRGRKWKLPYPAKQEPRRTRARPGGKVRVESHGNLEVIESTEGTKASGSPQAVIARLKEADCLGAAAARRVLAGIGTEIRRLTLLSGHRKSGPPQKHKPEGQVKGRSVAFAGFLDAE